MKKLIIILILLGVIGYALWYFLSPLFNNIEVNDDEGAIPPTAQVDTRVVENTLPAPTDTPAAESSSMSASTTPTEEESNSPTAESTSPPKSITLTRPATPPTPTTPAASPTPPPAPERVPTILKSEVVGTFGHPASGTARVVNREDGSRFIRFEDFKTINGPRLHVYLSKTTDGDDFIDLGPIRGTEGNINYNIPDGVDLEEYPYVLHWCVPFSVLFNHAKLRV